MMRKRGFTLIELLVVIAIIALLLSIILPSLRKAKNMGKAVVCLSNLKQWGVGLGAFMSENNDTFWKDYYTPGWSSDEERARRRWHNALWPYVETTDIFLCPTNKVGVVSDDETFRTWPLQDGWVVSDTEDLYGGYGFNSWACDWDRPGYEGWNIRKSSSKKISSSSIPILGDGMWNRTEVEDTHAPPAVRGEARATVSKLGRMCLDRHNKRTNLLFLDLSVRKVDLRELWTLKWHGKFNTGGIWTLADPGSEARWEADAPWMSGMKAY